MVVLKPFEFFEPATVREATEILSRHGDKAKVLAGGVDLVPRMRKREIRPECVLSIQKISGLDYIEGDGATGTRIGALSTLRSLEVSPLIQRDYPVLYKAVHSIASAQVKAMGTAVGNLCVATPASDVAVALLALGADVKIVGPGEERVVPIENFFLGVNRSVAKASELVTEIQLPGMSAQTGEAYAKVVRTAADIAKVNVAVVLTVTGNTCQEVRIALGAVAPVVIRARQTEEILRGKKLGPVIVGEAAMIAAEEAKPISDIRSTAAYRREVTRVVVRRAIERAVRKAKN